jgi:hypothetical protein
MAFGAMGMTHLPILGMVADRREEGITDTRLHPLPIVLQYRMNCAKHNGQGNSKGVSLNGARHGVKEGRVKQATRTYMGFNPPDYATYTVPP